MRLEEIVKGIYHVNYPSLRTLASTFLRFQEHYESMEFRGKFFSFEEHREWYTANSPGGKRTGRFTYYEDWEGFNIPSYAMRPFYEGRFDPLSRKEKTFLDAFEDKINTRFYVIGTYGDAGSDTLDHEIAHGLFYTNKRYRGKVMEVLDSLPGNARKGMAKYLRSSGYHEAVFNDEMHAYLLANSGMLDKTNIGKRTLNRASAELQSIFRNYYRK